MSLNKILSKERSNLVIDVGLGAMYNLFGLTKQNDRIWNSVNENYDISKVTIINNKR